MLPEESLHFVRSKEGTLYPVLPSRRGTAHGLRHCEYVATIEGIATCSSSESAVDALEAVLWEADKPQSK